MAQRLGLLGPWQCQVCRGMDCLYRRCYGPIRVFFRASGSWQSEGLFGQSFSIAPPVQALNMVPLPGVLLCCSGHQSLKGAPWVGSYSVVQCVRRLMDQLLYCSAAGGCGEREAMVMAPSFTCDSAVSPCFHGCPAFLHRNFPSQSPPSHPLDSSLRSRQQPLP